MIAVCWFYGIRRFSEVKAKYAKAELLFFRITPLPFLLGHSNNAWFLPWPLLACLLDLLPGVHLHHIPVGPLLHLLPANANSQLHISLVVRPPRMAFPDAFLPLHSRLCHLFVHHNARLNFDGNLIKKKTQTN